MAEAAPIVINDGQATPVSHTFNPKSVDNTLVKYMDESPSSFIAYPSITLGSRLPTVQNGNFKASIRVRIPVLETVSGSNPEGYDPGPKVAYSLNASIEFVIPDRASVAEKDDIVAYVSNLLAHTTIDDLVKTMALPY